MRNLHELSEQFHGLLGEVSDRFGLSVGEVPGMVRTSGGMMLPAVTSRIGIVEHSKDGVEDTNRHLYAGIPDEKGNLINVNVYPHAEKWPFRVKAYGHEFKGEDVGTLEDVYGNLAAPSQDLSDRPFDTGTILEMMRNESDNGRLTIASHERFEQKPGAGRPSALWSRRFEFNPQTDHLNELDD